MQPHSLTFSLPCHALALTAPAYATNTFSERHRHSAATLLNSCVTESTRRRYGTAWKHWRVFLDLAFDRPVDPARPDSHYLLLRTHADEVQQLIMMFMSYLFRDLHHTAEYINNALAGLSHQFRVSGRPTEVFRSVATKACRRALFLDPSAYRESRQALPATFAMVHSITTHFGTGSLHKRIIAVATALAFCCLLRASEYCFTNCAQDADRHVIRASQVLFERRQPPGASQPPQFVPAHQITPSMHISEFASVKLLILSAKNIPIRKGTALWFSTAGTGSEIHLARMLFSWAQDAGLRESDPFLSYRAAHSPSSRKHLSYARLNAVLKFTAQTFGLAGTRFSSHSLRIGGATHLRAGGADDGTILRMGRWRSLPACLGYQAPSTAQTDRLIVMLSTPTRFTIRDILFAHPTTTLTGHRSAPTMHTTGRRHSAHRNAT